MAVILDRKAYTADHPTWCPGCGDYSVLRAMQEACLSLGLPPERVVLVSGIGCSGKITSYFRSYGFHSIHGRTLPVATGIRLANHRLTVLAASGDGDAYGIGLSHLIHTIRRNVDITYVVMDNSVYGNTKGQTAPTSDTGYVSGSTPYGARERPIRPLLLAMASGIGFLGQGVSSNPQQLAELIREAIRYPGFSLINVLSPCVTYDEKHTYAWLREHALDVSRLDGYDPSDSRCALEVLQDELLPVGVLCRRPPETPFECGLPGRSPEAVPLVELDWAADRDRLEELASRRLV